MTVGKIYAGLLIAENWRAFKANKTSGGIRMVSLFYSNCNHTVCWCIMANVDIKVYQIAFDAGV